MCTISTSFLFFFFRLKASEVEEKNKGKELEDTQVYVYLCLPEKCCWSHSFIKLLTEWNNFWFCVCLHLQLQLQQVSEHANTSLHQVQELEVSSGFIETLLRSNKVPEYKFDHWALLGERGIRNIFCFSIASKYFCNNVCATFPHLVGLQNKREQIFEL